MKTFVVQELAGMSNILTNLLITDQTCITLDQRTKPHYEKYFNKPDFEAIVPAPTMWGAFTNQQKQEAIDADQWPAGKLNRPIDECDYLIFRATAEFDPNDVLDKGHETPFGTDQETIRISNIFTTPHSWTILQQRHHPEYTWEQRYRSLTRQIFDRGSLVTMGYQDICWIDIQDFFYQKKESLLIDFIQSEYGIEVDEFSIWILEYLHKNYWQKLNIDNEMLFWLDKFNDQLKDYKIINVRNLL